MQAHFSASFVRQGKRRVCGGRLWQAPCTQRSAWKNQIARALSGSVEAICTRNRRLKRFAHRLLANYCSRTAQNGAHLKQFLKLASDQPARTPKSAAAPSSEGSAALLSF